MRITGKEADKYLQQIALRMWLYAGHNLFFGLIYNIIGEK